MTSLTHDCSPTVVECGAVDAGLEIRVDDRECGLGLNDRPISVGGHLTEVRC